MPTPVNDGLSQSRSLQLVAVEYLDRSRSGLGSRRPLVTTIHVQFGHPTHTESKGYDVWPTST